MDIQPAINKSLTIAGAFFTLLAPGPLLHAQNAVTTNPSGPTTKQVETAKNEVTTIALNAPSHLTFKGRTLVFGENGKPASLIVVSEPVKPAEPAASPAKATAAVVTPK